MRTTAEVLWAAAILARRGWCQGVYSRDARGDEVDEASPAAVSFCALGAIRRASFELAGRPADVPAKNAAALLGEDAARVLCLAIAGGDDWENAIATWNDHTERTPAEVVAAFMHALELAGVAP